LSCIGVSKRALSQPSMPWRVYSAIPRSYERRSQRDCLRRLPIAQRARFSDRWGLLHPYAPHRLEPARPDIRHLKVLLHRRTGIRGPETAGPKPPLWLNRSPQRPGMPTAKPANCRLFASLRELPSSKECVATDAVVIEPVSASKFPANRERIGNFQFRGYPDVPSRLQRERPCIASPWIQLAGRASRVAFRC
jgi:hypothetical protein